MYVFAEYIAFSLYLLPLVTAQRGTFATFGITVGDQIVSKDSNLFVGEEGENTDADDALEPRSVIWNLRRPIPLFSKTVARLRIFETGIITTGGLVGLCQNPSLAETYIAPFWIATDITQGDGKIYFRMIDMADNTTKNTSEIQGLIDEVNTATSTLNAPDATNLTLADLETVIIITMENLRPFPGTFINPGHTLSFQTVIISTSSRSYAVHIYRTIDFSQLHYEEGDRQCREQGVVAYNDPGNYHFELTNFFFLKANNLLVHTNIVAYTTLGRYVLILDNVTMQPIPPLINCNVPVEQQDPYCQLGVSPNFCLYKQQGIYEHPSFCDYFILCASDPTVVSVHRCPPLTGYNPHIFNCDYAGYYRCVSINRGQVGVAVQRFQAFFQASSLVDIKLQTTPYRRITDEITDTLRFATHNNSCIGKTSSTLVIDISSCNHFLSCSNSRSIRMVCPANLFYDPASETCDWPQKVKCVDGVRPSTTPRITSTSVTSTTKATTTTTTKSTKKQRTSPPYICNKFDMGKKIDPLSCNHYYVCVYGHPIRKKCAHNLLYNRKDMVCDFANNVHCFEGERPPVRTTETTITKSSTKSKSSTPPPNICNKYENGNKIDPYSCNHFYTCSNGQPIRRTCAQNLFYSETGVCDFPRNVICHDGQRPNVPITKVAKTTFPTTTASSTVTSINVYTYCQSVTKTLLAGYKGKTTGLYRSEGSTILVPHPTSCVNYFKCVEGKLIQPLTCHYGHYFDFFAQKCLSGDSYSCKGIPPLLP